MMVFTLVVKLYLLVLELYLLEVADLIPMQFATECT